MKKKSNNRCPVCDWPLDYDDGAGHICDGDGFNHTGNDDHPEPKADGDDEN